ncbi:MAG: transglutaminase family protein [Bacteroidales bacterium]|nr:transglutaminase family protein [Bacteroidales bacterium]
MKKFIVLLFISFSSIAYAQKELDEKWLEIPETLKEHAYAIVREYKVEYILNSTNSLEENVSMILSILDNEGKDFATQVWHYDIFSKYSSGEIQIFDKNGIRLEKKSLRDMNDYGTSGMSNFFDDSRLKVYEPLIKETPYTLIINFSKKHNGFFQLPTWIPQQNSNIAVENASLTILNKGNIDFKTKLINLHKGNYEYTEEGQKKEWEIHNIKAFKPESYVRSSQLPAIVFPLTQFQVQGFAGNTNTWEGFGKWSADLINDRDILPEETVAKILEMVKGLDNPKEKAKVIYSWMQENTRYISIQYGIGGWQPYTAQEVDNLKYGDCKALANYTKALFKVADIDAYYSLIRAGRGEKYMDKNFPSNQFNHVILCVPFSGDTTWAECTADNIAFGYLGDFTDDRYALVIDKDKSKLQKTTAYPKEQNLQVRKADINIHSDGSLHATITTEFSGIQSNYRRAQINEDEKDRKNYLYNSLSISGFTIKDLSYEYKKEVLPEIIENLEIDAVKYASVTSNRIFLPLNLLNKSVYKPEKDTSRKNTIFISLAYIDSDSLIYQIPEGYEIERLPKDQTIESRYGNYSSRVIKNGNEIIYLRNQEQNSGEFPAENWSEFRKYKLDIVKADKAVAILRKTSK